MICFKQNDIKANPEREACYDGTEVPLDEATENASASDGPGDIEEPDNVHMPSSAISLKLAVESPNSKSRLDDKLSISDMGLSRHFENLDEIKPEDFKDDAPIVRQVSDFSRRDRLRLFLNSIQWDIEEDPRKESEDQDNGMLRRSRSSYAPDVNDDEFWDCSDDDVDGDSDDDDYDNDDDEDDDGDSDYAGDDDDNNGKLDRDQDKDIDSKCEINNKNDMFTFICNGSNGSQIASGQPNWTSRNALLQRLCLSHHCPGYRLTNGHLLRFFDDFECQNKRIRLDVTFTGKEAPRTKLNSKVQAHPTLPLNTDEFSIPLLPRRFQIKKSATAALLATNPTVPKHTVKETSDCMEFMADQSTSRSPHNSMSNISKEANASIGSCNSTCGLGKKHPRDSGCDTINGIIASVNNSGVHARKKICLEHEQPIHDQVILGCYND